MTDWKQECIRLQAELDAVRAEMEEWKEKFNRFLLWKEQPRLAVKGSTPTYTTMGFREGDDGK